MVEIDINTDILLKKFNELDFKNQKKTMKSALRAAMGILVKQTKSNLKSVVANANKVTVKGKFKGLKLINGIQTKVWRDGKTAKVNIMKDGRLKWFELGTNQRVTKKTMKRKVHSTGSIKASNFFTNARQQTEDQVFSSLDKKITDQILKIWNKKNTTK